MVTETEIIHGIRKAWSYAEAMGIAEVFSDPSPLKASAEFVGIARSTSATYEEIYLLGLAGGQYNFILADYAYLQFSGRDEDSLRYAYYPNPFLGTSREAVSSLTELRTYVEEGIIDMEEFLHKVSEIRYTQHPPLVRYENSSEQHRRDPRHPCSHFHFGHHAENRWPVRRVLTPGTFALLVFKYFYFTNWLKGELVAGSVGQISLDQALISSKMDCRILPQELFSVEAEAQFSFG